MTSTFRRAALAALLATLALPAAAAANIVAPNPLSLSPSMAWEVKGSAAAFERQGNVLYVGGSFGYVGPPNTRLGAVLATSTGEAKLGLPRIVGTDVRAVIADGAGGWFIGGRFTRVGDLSCRNVAHVRSDLTVDPAFCGSMDMGLGTSETPIVNALARSGTRLYVGGRFKGIRGVERSNLAALSLATGAVEPFNAGAIAWVETRAAFAGGPCTRVCGPDVNALAVGTSLFVGGNFTSIGGVERWSVAALDPATGAVRTAWDPKPAAYLDRLTGTDEEFQVPVHAVALAGSRVYVGGEFNHVDGTNEESDPRRDGIVAIDGQSGAVVTAFNARVTETGTVRAIAATGSTVFVGGRFTSVGTVTPLSGGISRANLAAFGLNGQALAWNPAPNDEVLSVALVDTAVVIGGTFMTVAGVARERAAAILRPHLAPPGVVHPWAPTFDGSPAPRVNAVAVAGSSVYVGGTFAATGGLRRTSLAAFDLTTGRPTSWAPALGLSGGVGGVTDFARVGNVLYVLGNLDSLGGQARPGLGALALDSGALLPWTPVAITPTVGHLQTVAASATAVYVGGGFQQSRGAAFDLTVALDAATGAALPWAPSVVGIYLNGQPSVNDILVSGPTVYLAGNFGGAGGQPGRGLTAVDALTGAPTGFGAAVAGGTGPPRAMALRLLPGGATRLYFTGNFAQVGGQPRGGAAAVDGTTGAVDAWAPVNGQGFSILFSGGEVLIGGGAGIRSFGLEAPATAGAFSVPANGFVRPLINGPNQELITGGSIPFVGGDVGPPAIFGRPLPVAVGSSSAEVAKRDRWSAPIRCPRTASRRCVVEAVLREQATRKRTVIGQVHQLTIPAGKSRRAVFVLTRRGRALLDRRERVPVVVEVTSTDARGRVTVARRSFVLHRPAG